MTGVLDTAWGATCDRRWRASITWRLNNRGRGPNCTRSISRWLFYCCFPNLQLCVQHTATLKTIEQKKKTINQLYILIHCSLSIGDNPCARIALNSDGAMSLFTFRTSENTSFCIASARAHAINRKSLEKKTKFAIFTRERYHISSKWFLHTHTSFELVKINRYCVWTPCATLKIIGKQ